MTTSSSVAIAVLVAVGYFEARKKMKMHPVLVEEEEKGLGKIEQQKSVLSLVAAQEEREKETRKALSIGS